MFCTITRTRKACPKWGQAAAASPRAALEIVQQMATALRHALSACALALRCCRAGGAAPVRSYTRTPGSLLPPTRDLDGIAELLRDGAKCVVMLGAGASVAAGLPDFRTPGSRPASSHEARRRRGRDVDSPWRRVAATPRPRRGYSAKASRGRDLSSEYPRGTPRRGRDPASMTALPLARRLRRRTIRVRADDDPPP